MTTVINYEQEKQNTRRMTSKIIRATRTMRRQGKKSIEEKNRTEQRNTTTTKQKKTKQEEREQAEHKSMGLETSLRRRTRRKERI